MSADECQKCWGNGGARERCEAIVNRPDGGFGLVLRTADKEAIRALLSDLATKGERIAELEREVERQRGLKGDLSNDFQRVCGWLRTAIDTLDVEGCEGTAAELRSWMESLTRDRIAAAKAAAHTTETP